MTNQKIARVGTVFANYANEVPSQEIREGSWLRFKICWMATWIQHKNWIEIKELFVFMLSFYDIISFGIRKNPIWSGSATVAAVPNRGTAKSELSVHV